jgi:radical SAM protein with 4Fe4S-binding SPASM domain
MPAALQTSSSTLGPPEFLLVEITSRCNLKCSMCPLTTGETPSSREPGHMSEAVWKSLVPFAQETGLVNIGGYGEPLSNPKCFAYLRELDAAGVRTILTTNGTMITKRLAEQLSTLAHLEEVKVSIDSPDPEIYRRIRGGSLEKGFEGIRHLTSVLKPSQVAVLSVLMRSNADSLPAFPPLLASLNVTRFVVQGLIDYAAGLDEEEVRWRNGLPTYVARLAEAARQAGVGIEFSLPERVAAELRDPRDAAAAVAAHVGAPTATVEGTKQCFAPWDAPVVDKDGRVFPCCFALTHASAMMGDLRESRPDEIWRGEKFRQFRRDIVDARTTPAVCRTCTVVPTGPHILGRYSARLIDEGSVLSGSDEMRLVVENTGSVTWTAADRINIGTASPRDAPSAYYHPSWIGTNRISSFVEPSVPPGATATFAFRVTPAAEPPFGVFQLVVENQCWLPEPRFRIRAVRPEPAPPSFARKVRRALGRMRRQVGMLRASAALVDDLRRPLTVP